MSYNTKLEERIDAAVKLWRNVEKKKMFGGVGYLLKGNMAFGIHRDFLIVRMDKEEGELEERCRLGEVDGDREGVCAVAAGEKREGEGKENEDLEGI
jgi:hypothetical protein